jgi:DNA polymerase-3 subunit beta
MRLALLPSDLLPAVSAVARIAKSQSIPIINSVLLRAKKGYGFVEVCGTDLDLSLCLRVPADVQKAGAVALPAKLLATLLQRLPQGDAVTLELGAGPDGWVTLTSPETSYRLCGLPAEDFPLLPSPEGEATTLEAPALAKLIARVRMAITGADSRYYLSGALLGVGPDEITLSATDGHRMSVTRAAIADPDLRVPSREPFQVIVQRSALDELPVLLSGAKLVTLRRTETYLSWQAEQADGFDHFLSVKTVEGVFPNFERALDAAKTSGSPWKASLGRLVTGINRVRPVASGKASGVEFNFGTRLELRAESPELRSARDEVQLSEGVEGGPISAGLNAAYVLDFLSAAKGEGVEWVRGRLTSPEHAVLFEPADDEGATWSYVVMPMRMR